MSKVESTSCPRGERSPRRGRRPDAVRALEALRKDVLSLTDRIEQLQETIPRKEES